MTGGVDGGCVPQARDQRGDFRQVEGQVWRAGDNPEGAVELRARHASIVANKLRQVANAPSRNAGIPSPNAFTENRQETGSPSNDGVVAADDYLAGHGVATIILFREQAVH